MKFVAFSDTHGYHKNVDIPDGDVLLFAGDLCSHGTLREVEEFGAFLALQPHKYKVIIAGNHDWAFERQSEAAREALGPNIHYLQDEEVVLNGIKVYGSPWQPEFGRWAFNLPRGTALAEVWSKIPEDTQILISHGPPNGILDKTARGVDAGCRDLRARLRALPKLKYSIFGHIHEAYGQETVDGVQFLNVSLCDLYQRRIANQPMVFELT